MAFRFSLYAILIVMVMTGCEKNEQVLPGSTTNDSLSSPPKGQFIKTADVYLYKRYFYAPNFETLPGNIAHDTITAILWDPGFYLKLSDEMGRPIPFGGRTGTNWQVGLMRLESPLSPPTTYIPNYGALGGYPLAGTDHYAPEIIFALDGNDQFPAVRDTIPVVFPFLDIIAVDRHEIGEPFSIHHVAHTPIADSGYYYIERDYKDPITLTAYRDTVAWYTIDDPNSATYDFHLPEMTTGEHCAFTFSYKNTYMKVKDGIKLRYHIITRVEFEYRDCN